MPQVKGFIIYLVIAKRISDRQIIVQQVRRYSRVLVCMYVCIYVRKKFRIVDSGFVTADCALFEFHLYLHIYSAVSFTYPIVGESI